ncbi:hypothetical protein PAPHI01_0441 [Pancytospora philotis]|nr:hypothetical protein PAPHI01_0441 [Pancytospora philotis]
MMAGTGLTWLAAFAAVIASGVPRKAGSRRATADILNRISPYGKCIPSAKITDKAVVEVINSRALSILRKEQGCAEGDPNRYGGSSATPNMIHRITTCVLRARCLRSCINKLLRDKRGPLELTLLANILRVATTTKVVTRGLEADLIVPVSENLPSKAEEAISILRKEAAQQFKFSPRQFISVNKYHDNPYDTIAYLVKEEKNGTHAVQSCFEAIMGAWCDEMNRGSDSFTPYIVSLINELETDLWAEKACQYNLRNIMLSVLTSQTNTKVVEALDEIVFRKNKTEEVILAYIMGEEHRSVSPWFVLQYMLHIQSELDMDEQRMLELQLRYFMMPAHAVERQLVIISNPQILRLMSVRLLLSLLYSYWEVPAFRSGLPCFYYMILQTVEPDIFESLRDAVNKSDKADFIESAQGGFFDSAAAAQMEALHCQRTEQGQQCARNEDGGQTPVAVVEDEFIDVVGLNTD